MVCFTSGTLQSYRQFTGQGLGRLAHSARGVEVGGPRPDVCYDEGVWKLLSARGASEFAKHVVPAVLKPARTLWNEIIGFFFLCLAVLFGSGLVRAYLAMSSGPKEDFGDLLRLVGSGFLTALMLYFGITSFLRARKISRS